MTRTADSSGFTLIELLIATVIFTVVISSVYGACRITFSNIDATETSLVNRSLGQSALICMADDLQYISSAPESRFIAQKDRGSSANSVTITFNTSNRLIVDPYERKGSTYTVSYTMQQVEDTGLFKLYRSSREAHLDEEKNASSRYLLIDQLKDIVFIFYNEDGDEFAEWEKATGEEQEAGNSLLPVMVRIELTFPPGDSGREQPVIAMNVALPKNNSNESL